MTNLLYSKIRKQGAKVYHNLLYPLLLKHRAKTIGKKDRIEVVFFAINVAMWRYQGVYELLSKDKRFNCHIVLTGARQYSKEQKTSNLILLRNYFDNQGITYFDYDEFLDEGYDVKAKIDPDIIFYPQPYFGQYVSKHSFLQFKSKLLCYIPYMINVLKDYDDFYNLYFHNLAWKIYCPLYEEKLMAKNAKNHGRNWIVSGYYNTDRYLNQYSNDVWKIKEKSYKRLIWAPHFSIVPESSWIHARSNFLWMAQLMVDISKKYSDCLQIAFKPHPWLKTELYKHPEWGKEKTDKYYQYWVNCDNTQLESGDFVDLFKTSNAMIHDSGSFTAEYLYVNKPVAFVSIDIEEIKSDHSKFGCAALDQHYIVKNEDDVLSFITQVVLAGNDSKKEQRTEFFENILKPNVTGTTSEFIVNDIKKSLGLKQ